MKKKHGFTLIELLVVIAIISILATILLPSLTMAKDLAKTVVCSTQVRNLNTAWAMYTSDHDGKVMPCFSGWNDSLGNGNGIDDEWQLYWANQILPYLGGRDAGQQAGQMWTNNDPDSISHRKCPSNPEPIRGGDGWITMNQRVEEDGLCPAISSFVSPGSMVIFADAFWEHRYNLSAWTMDFTYPHNSNKDSNFGFADGHVETTRTRANKDLLWQVSGNYSGTPDGLDDAYPPKQFSYRPFSNETGYPGWNYSVFGL